MPGTAGVPLYGVLKMIVIALVGGSLQARESLAKTLVISRPGEVQEVCVSHRCYHEQTRIKAVQECVKPGRRMPRVLVYTHALMAVEGEALRSVGAYMWHLEGLPSNFIPIQLGDLLVTTAPEGHRHYLGPLEALSEVYLRASHRKGCI